MSWGIVGWLTRHRGPTVPVVVLVFMLVLVLLVLLALVLFRFTIVIVGITRIRRTTFRLFLLVLLLFRAMRILITMSSSAITGRRLAIRWLIRGARSGWEITRTGVPTSIWHMWGWRTRRRIRASASTRTISGPKVTSSTASTGHVAHKVLRLVHQTLSLADSGYMARSRNMTHRARNLAHR